MPKINRNNNNNNKRPLCIDLRPPTKVESLNPLAGTHLGILFLKKKKK